MAKKRKFYLMLIVPLLLAILGFVNVNSGYAVYVSNKQVGVIKSTKEVEGNLDNLLAQKSTEMGQEVFVDTSLDYKRVWLGKNELTDNAEIKKNLEEELAFKTTATAVYVNGKKMFLLPNQKDANKLINDIKNRYSEENSSKTEIIEDVEFKDEEVLVEEVQTIENAFAEVFQGTESALYTVEEGDTLSGIASKYNVSIESIKELNPNLNETIKVGHQLVINNSKPLLNVKVSSNKEEEVNIPFEVIVNKTAKLPLGKSKVTQQGKDGKKLVEYEVVKVNGIKTSTKVVKETIIEHPDNKIVETGNGKLLKPTDGYVSSQFGQRWGKLHKGIDIANNYGANVYAASAGKVTRAGWGTGYGKIIAIQHSDGTITRYAHLSSMSVKVGDWVERGQTIGKVGTTGTTTGPNLHFEVLKNGDLKNPISYI